MNCREFVDFLMDYLDGQLPENVRSTFEEHLRACPPCEVYLDSYAETVRLGKAVLCAEQTDEACDEREGPPRVSFDGAPPMEVPEGLIRAILAAREQAE